MKDSLKQTQKKTKTESPVKIHAKKPSFIFARIPFIVISLCVCNALLIAAIIGLGYVIESTYIFEVSKNAPSGSLLETLLPAKSFENLSVSSRAVVIYDDKTKAIIFGKNQNLRFSPASTAKIMTATLALETYPADMVFTVPQNIYSVEGSKMGLYPGETISLESLLFGLMLPSGNDAAYVIASYYPGGREEFINAMNTKAKALKLTSTYFVDPAGYEDGNYTTAFDLARLAAYAMQNSTFRMVVSTQNKLVFNTLGTISHELKNINELLAIPGVTGVKTGFTNEAEGVLVTSFETNGKRYIITVLRSGDRFGDTAVVIERILTSLQKNVSKTPELQ